MSDIDVQITEIHLAITRDALGKAEDELNDLETQLANLQDRTERLMGPDSSEDNTWKIKALRAEIAQMQSEIGSLEFEVWTERLEKEREERRRDLDIAIASISMSLGYRHEVERIFEQFEIGGPTIGISLI